MSGSPRGLPAWAAWWHGGRLDWLAALALPVAVQAPEWLGLVRTNPQIALSGLWGGLRPGLVAGTPGYLDPNSAWTAQALGHLAAEQWLHGTVPWWNPLSGVGAPLAAEMQPAALFLPFILLMHFSGGWLLLHMVWQAIAGLGAWCLLRRLGLGRAAVLAGTLLYGCNGTLAWFSHGPERAAAFLPWVLLGVEGCRTRFGGAGLAVALAGSVYAGWPETAYLDGLLAAAWTLGRAAEGWRFLRRVGLGVGLGLLMAAPAAVPFITYLSAAETGAHAVMARWALAPRQIGMIVLPYLNGPPGGMGPAMQRVWGNMGGYLGPVAVLLASVGSLGGREAWLRRVLGAWVVVWLARAAGIGPAIRLTNLIPLVGRAAPYRYILPSLALAIAVLAAFALEDWREGQAGQVVRVRSGGVAAGLCILGAVMLCLPGTSALWGQPYYKLFFAGSVVWAVCGCAVAGWMLARAPARALVAGLLALVAAEAMGDYALARIGAPRGGRPEPGLVAFLRAQTGLERIVSFPGGVGPNEAASIGVASVDETMLPVPARWARFVRGALRADPVNFLYWQDGPARLVRDWPVLKSLGVGWLVTGPEDDPAHAQSNFARAVRHRAAVLAPGVALRGRLAAGLPGTAPVTRVGLDVGTFGGRAAGRLRLVLSWAGGTAAGTAGLAGAVDDAPLDFMLDRAAPPGVALDWSVTQSGGAAAAVWLYGPAGAPRFSDGEGLPGIGASIAFRSADKVVYRLAGAAPYWQAEGCRITAAGREDAASDCAAGATLVRRELFFPGWRAAVNGTATPIAADGLFQRIALPPGHAVIRFGYAPRGIGWSCLAGAAGAVLTFWRVMRGRRQGGWAGAGVSGEKFSAGGSPSSALGSGQVGPR